MELGDWRNLLNSIPTLGVYVTDLDRRILFWNRAAETLTGFSAEEVVGRACRDNMLQHVDRHGRELCQESTCPLFQSMRRNKGTDRPLIVRAHTKSGKLLPVAVLVAPIHGAGGEVIGGIEIFRDAKEEFQQSLLAESVQKMMLPDKSRFLPEWPVAFSNIFAESIGGDFIHIFPAGEHRFAGFLADISGHGVPSALIVSYLRGAVFPLEGRDVSPKEILTFLNREYRRLEFSEHYFSALAFLVDLRTKEIVLSGAGHPHPILLKPDGSHEEIDTGGDLIGLVVEDPVFQETRRSLSAGRYLLYSDGVSESQQPQGGMLGTKGLVQFANNLQALSRQEMADKLVQSVFQWTECSDPKDDMSVLVIGGENYF